jgi:hypothetical protein
MFGGWLKSRPCSGSYPNVPATEEHRTRRATITQRSTWGGGYDLPFCLFGALGFGDRLPAGVPGLPDGLTHLWLAPEYCRRVLIGTSGGWAETRDIRPSLGVRRMQGLRLDA